MDCSKTESVIEVHLKYNKQFSEGNSDEVWYASAKEFKDLSEVELELSF